MPFKAPEFPFNLAPLPPLPGPAPVPLPYPNMSVSASSLASSNEVLVEPGKIIPEFSPLPASLPPVASINAQAAMARGFSQHGAALMYFRHEMPRSLPDQLLLSTFTPNVPKVLVSMITPESSSPLPDSVIKPHEPPAPSSASAIPSTLGDEAG